MPKYLWESEPLSLCRLSFVVPKSSVAALILPPLSLSRVDRLHEQARWSKLLSQLWSPSGWDKILDGEGNYLKYMSFTLYSYGGKQETQSWHLSQAPQYIHFQIQPLSSKTMFAPRLGCICYYQNSHLREKFKHLEIPFQSTSWKSH